MTVRRPRPSAAAWAATAWAAVLVIGCPALAQQRGAAPANADVVPPGGQVRAPAAGDRAPAIDQLSRSNDRLARTPDTAQRRFAPPMADQLHPLRREPVASTGPAPKRDVRAAPQLSTGPATAAAPEALSSPTQGRRQALERLGGRDRCDPQAPTQAGACARVIETRSGEFVRADPLVLSPEQRLLIDQRLREGTSTTQMAVQKIGNNNVDPDSLDAQGLASLTLLPRTDTPAETTPTAEADAAAVSLVQAIIEGARTLNVPR